MAFGAHLRPTVTSTFDDKTSEAVLDATEQANNDLPSAELQSAEPSVDSETAPPANTGNPEDTAPESILSDPDQEHLAHMEAFQDALRDIVEMRTLQGDTQATTRVPLVAKGLMGYRDQPVPLAELCDQVIDQAYFKVPQSENGPGEMAGGSDRWVMTPGNQAAEKTANLETAQMIHDHLEQSGINLDLVAEQFQTMLESAEREIPESPDGTESSVSATESTAEGACVPALINEPVFEGAHDLRLLTDVEYQEIQKAAETKPSTEDKDDPDEEEEDDTLLSSQDLAANLVLLSMHMQQARSRKQLKAAQTATHRPAPPKPPLQGSASPSQSTPPTNKGDQKEAAGRSFSLPLPRLPRLPSLKGDGTGNTHSTGMDYEAFVRNRRTGQMLATRDALLKMDRLMHLRNLTTDPDVLKNINGKLEKQAKRMVQQGSKAFDQKGLDFLARGGADPAVITGTMEQMEKWKKQFGAAEDFHRNNSLGDALGDALEKLAKLIQDVIDRVTGRATQREDASAKDGEAGWNP
ncbi:hypothetical protein [Acidithiobacillus sulfurivorans]|uniref:Uncharacterized protein n=1 Tax=Acidithiobacillus sulfurivorans TaxID=1958756 RepID=A0ABS6A0U0_9PROT|nr:hypothetical protein [Acidithiobacillus sulfurivorans]MBU2761107.1 hypothetical protein [Acidithiobacillus sulfurivorans]